LFAFERTTPKDAATSAEGQAIKDAASFLRNILIPATIKEFVRQPTLIPMDSATFTSVLHARGINMRYLGHFVNTVSKEHGKSGSTTDASLDLLSAIAVSEMIIRGAKHVWRKTVRPCYSLHSKLKKVCRLRSPTLGCSTWRPLRRTFSTAS